MSEAVQQKENNEDKLVVEEVKEEVVQEEPNKEAVDKEAPTKKEDMSEEELEAYSKSVQKRIKKLTERYRHEEKDKEEALALSKRLLEENNKLKNRVKTLDSGYVSEYGSRLQSQSQQAKKLYTDAFAAGDAEKMAEAQQAMAQIAVEQQNFNTAKLRVEQQAKLQQPQQQPQAKPQQAVQQQPQAKPDPRAEQWASENEWFGKDTIMTTAAFTLHNQLTNEEGFDVNTEEYYNAIDSRMRKEFPHKFQTKTANKTGGVQVASAGNSASRNKQGRRTVKLTPSQVAIAKKLGVPLEEYAKHVKE